ncbi:transcription factor MAMYB-like [Bidens hawaiensis]|uniref:transcription factor MAMYB-like n=1 Tax=Bidens hawaiensis TaxID=980011 RepID=UPI00404A11BD
MEFLDEETRPRFLLQSKPPGPNHTTQTQTHIHKPTIFISLSLSALFFILSQLYFNSDPTRSIFIWVSLSLLIGPFAPLNLTAGDIRVGLGPVLVPGPSRDPEPVKRSRIKPRKPDTIASVVVEGPDEPKKPVNELPEPTGLNNNKRVVVGVEESEWSVSDIELLKKQMVKYPVGMPGRWEAVAGAFNGNRKVESVVKMAKVMGGVGTGMGMKMNDSDSFSRFLKDRKAVDPRVDQVIENERQNDINVGNENSWSSGEDIALLNALKAFPKDVAMRWEKITAAVPGRSKAACMKRVADLKKDFRSTKAASQA